MTLLEYRVGQDWSQRELATRWNFALRSIRDWESGKRPPRPFNKARMRYLSDGAVTDWPEAAE